MPITDTNPITIHTVREYVLATQDERLATVKDTHLGREVPKYFGATANDYFMSEEDTRNAIQWVKSIGEHLAALGDYLKQKTATAELPANAIEALIKGFELDSQEYKKDPQRLHDTVIAEVKKLGAYYHAAGKKESRAALGFSIDTLINYLRGTWYQRNIQMSDEEYYSLCSAKAESQSQDNMRQVFDSLRPLVRAGIAIGEK